jgi:hypothetical protein
VELGAARPCFTAPAHWRKLSTMRQPLLHRSELIVFAAYEAMAISVIVFVPSGWQFVGIIASLVAIVLVAAAYRLTTKGRETAKARPPASASAPWWLTVVTCTLTIVAVGIVFRLLGAGHSWGWFGAAFGFWMPVSWMLDRWWSSRPTSTTQRSGGGAA